MDLTTFHLMVTRVVLNHACKPLVSRFLCVVIHLGEHLKLHVQIKRRINKSLTTSMSSSVCWLVGFTY